MKLGNLTFDQSSVSDVLELFGKTVDKDGYIIEKDHPEQKVLTKKGEQIRLEEWAGVVKGSESFVKSDVFSLIELAKDLD